MTTDEANYAEAMAELEAILRDLEDGDVDIDRLAAQVRRAAELVRQCRGRLADATTEVTRIVAELEGELPAGGSGGGAANAGRPAGDTPLTTDRP